MTKPQVLLIRPAWDRIADRATSQGLSIDPVIQEEDGTFTFQNESRQLSELSPEIAWLSNDAFKWPHIRDLAIALLKSTSIKWLQSSAAGLDNPLFKGIFDNGVRLTNSDAQGPAIADYILATVLAHFHPTQERRTAQEAKEWKQLPFREIAGTRWMIIGFGHIGQETAKRAKGFDAHVTGVRRSSGAHPHADVLIGPKDILGQLPGADVVVLSCPLTEDTKHIANAEFFTAMKKGATLVNIGRGGLVDESALMAALEKDQPAYAILDVFGEEPLPADNPLWENPKVAVTAHTSFYGSGTRPRGDDLFLENLSHYLGGEPLRNEVTKKHFT